MRLLDRYVARSFVNPFIFCTLLFISMYIVVDALNNLDDFLNSTSSAKVVVLYYASMLPMILSYILPSSTLIAALYGLGVLNRHQEIVAMKAGGVSGFQILRPVLHLAFLISLALLFMNESITPKSAVLSTSIKQGMISKGGDSLAQRSIENVAILSKGNRMLFARELHLNTKTLYDVILLEHYPNMSLKSKKTAQRAVYDGSLWTLYNVMEYDVDMNGDVQNKPRKFHSLPVDIHESPEEFLNQYTQSEFMSYRQLKAYLQTTEVTGFKTSNRLKTEMHEKISHPFICFIMLLVSAPIALISRRGGAMISIGVGLIVIVAYYGCAAFSGALGKGGVIPAEWAAWLPNLIFFSAGLFMLRKNL